MDESPESLFRSLFGHSPRGRIRSPLRICPLGAHVDHQNGRVTGMAIDAGVDLFYDPDETDIVRVRSMDFPDEDYFRLDQVPPMLPGFWGNYLRGAVRSLARTHVLRRGVLGVVRGRLPMGGLSSSAAVTTAYLLALCDVNGIEPTGEDLIRYSHWVETEFIGLKNGILDQSANILSRDGFLMTMDCLTNEWDLVPKGPSMPPFDIVIVNSGFTKALIGTDYNNRVDECTIAACVLAEHAGLEAKPYRERRLRDIGEADWNTYGSLLPGRYARRARHFFSENERVLAGTLSWRTGDLATFGRLMTESGHSSVDDYQCGCPELTTIFHTLIAVPGVHGARFSGAGYRGCCIGLSDPSARGRIEERIAQVYPRLHPEYADRYRVHFHGTADGARILRSCRTPQAVHVAGARP